MHGENGMSKAVALLPRTKRSVLQMLLEGEASTATLAARARIHESVVRRHLEELVASGLVVSRSDRAARGRPRTLYSLTVDGRDTFYAKYDLVVDALARATTQSKGSAVTRARFVEAAKTIAADAGAPKSSESSITFLREMGFAPELRKQGSRNLVVSHNCPILRTAAKYPQFACEAFHSNLLSELLGLVTVSLRQTMATGAPECIHELVK